LKENVMTSPVAGRLALVLSGALLLAACGGSGTGTSGIPTAPTTPTTPTTPAATVTQTFTGDLNTNGASSFPFSTQAGTVTAILTTLSDPTVTVGLALGSWTGTACSIAVANDAALSGATVVGTATAATNVCVRIYDVGFVTTTLAYTITVTHP
jgi:hypothetical protein